MKTLCGLILALATLPVHAQILAPILYHQTAAASQVAPLAFSPVAGTYSSTQTVTISTATSLAVICYTTDGTTPTETANLCLGGTTSTYSTPISVATTQTVKAIGTKALYTDSTVGSAAYTISAGGYTDNFPGSSLSGNWTCSTTATGYTTTPYITANQFTQSQTVSSGSLCAYTGGTFGTDQQSQATIGALGSTGLYYVSQGVCIHLDVSGNNGYCFAQGGSGYINKATAGVWSSIGNYYAPTFTVGDVLLLKNVGGTITLYQNGTLRYTATDSTFTGGAPGLEVLGYMYASRFSWATWSGQ
jgi:hypothetical protein